MNTFITKYIHCFLEISSHIGWGIPLGVTLLLSWIFLLIASQGLGYYVAWLTTSTKKLDPILKFMMINFYNYHLRDGQSLSYPYKHNTMADSEDNTSDGTIAVFMTGLYVLVTPSILSIILWGGTVSMLVGIVVGGSFLLRYVIRLTKTVKSHINNLIIHNKDNI